MSLTRTIKPLRGAHRRHSEYEARIRVALEGRPRIWETYAWITAEARHLDADSMRDLIAELRRIARRLNARNGGPDDDGQ